MVLAEALNKNVTIRYWHRGAIGHISGDVTEVSGSKISVGENFSLGLPLNETDFHVEEVYVDGKSVYDYDPNNPWFKK